MRLSFVSFVLYAQYNVCMSVEFAANMNIVLNSIRTCAMAPRCIGHLISYENDQEGERLRDARYIYPNPYVPDICPVLSLAIYHAYLILFLAAIYS